jgi:hypothetical protein
MDRGDDLMTPATWFRGEAWIFRRIGAMSDAI